MDQPIKGPDQDRPYLDSKEAGKWIGDIGWKLFEDLMAEHLPTVQPVWMGGLKFWAWMDIAVLAYLLKRASTTPPAKGKRKDQESEQP